MRLVALLGTVGLLTTGLLSACSTGHAGTGARSTTPGHRAAATTAARTVVHTFQPYRADGTPSVASVRTEDGYCWDSSLAASSPTAFRCFAAGSTGQILDPCFAPTTADPTSVLCVDDPWSRATTLHLTRALPKPVAGVAGRPWAVQLADGTRCAASTGTVPTVGGVNLSYHCAGGLAAAVTSADAGPWTAVYARPDATVLQHTSVAGVWRT